MLRSVFVGAALGSIEPPGGGPPLPAVYLWPETREDMPVLLARVAGMAPAWVAPGVRDGRFVHVHIRPLSIQDGTWRILAYRRDQLEVTRDLPGGRVQATEVTQHVHDVWVGGMTAEQMRNWAWQVARLGLLVVILDGPATDGRSWSVSGADTWIPPSNVEIVTEAH